MSRWGTSTVMAFATLLPIASSGCAVFASKADYADYRAVRTASDERAKLLAMARYASEHPDGRWIGEISTARAAAEDATYAANSSTRDGLEFYLAAYPNGRYTAQARPRLAALATVAERRESERERVERLTAERRAQQEERRRTWVSRAAGYWVRTLLGIQNWGSPIADVARGNPAFSRAFGENPRPQCTRTDCVKFYQNQYAIPVPGATRIDRTIQLALRLRLEEGRVERAELLLPNKGFSRWYEMENRTVVVDEDPDQRAMAMAFALERIAPAVVESLRGAQQVESVSLDTLLPLTQGAAQQSTGTSTPGSGGADGDDEAVAAAPTEPEATATAPTATTPTGAPPPTGPDVDALLARAAGVDTATPATPAATPEPATAAPPPAPSLAPVVVRAWQTAGLRVVVFRAADDDYEPAIDGIVIERIRETAAPSRPATRPR